MVHGYASFTHHFFQITKTNAIHTVPANTLKYDGSFEMAVSKIRHSCEVEKANRFARQATKLLIFATESFRGLIQGK